MGPGRSFKVTHEQTEEQDEKEDEERKVSGVGGEWSAEENVGVRFVCLGESFARIIKASTSWIT